MPVAPRTGRTLSRRRLLATALGWSAAAVVGVTGCTNRSGSGSGSASASPDPDTVARDAASAAELRLAELTAATAGDHPALRSTLAPVEAAHRDHARVLSRGPSGTGAAAGPSSSSSSSSTTPGAPGGPSVPADPAQAMTVLARAQRATAAALLARLDGVSGDLARLLASVAASDSAQARLVGGVS